MSEPVIEVRGIVKRYGARAVLHEISFDVGRGGVVALMGPSGGGKSTLLRCLVGLARALAMDPHVLFMDEPTSALDPARVGDLVELLRRLAEEAKLTLVIVTHEMRFAAKLADRAVVLYEGRVIEDGAPAEVLARPSDPRTRRFLGLEG